MLIPDDIRSLLDPILSGSLSIPVDDFVLHAPSGPVSLAATLRVDSSADTFQLEVRDSSGKDLRSHFSRSNRLTTGDTLTANGTVANKHRLEFRKIWPPNFSTIPIIGDIKSTSATLDAEEIHAIPHSHEQRTNREALEELDRLNPHMPPVSKPIEEPMEGHLYSHVAVFAHTELKFVNGGIEWLERHPFWGGQGGTKESTWDAEAFGGTFSLMQNGTHLEVGLRHHAVNDEDAGKTFDAFLRSVAFTHAIFPWPSYLQIRRDGATVSQVIKVVRQNQGGMVPLRDRDGHQTPEAPTNLIRAVAELFRQLPDNDEGMANALWMLRGADSDAAPYPLQISTVCSILEGLRTDLFKSRSVVPPEAFTEIKGEALTWLKGLKDQTEDPQRTDMLRRLERVVSDWTFQDRRVEWFAAFGPLFPGRTQWLSELFNLFRDNRHGPAHGNFSSVTNRPPHTSIDALGRLAGFVNLIIAAQAGYKGSILESPYGNRRMEL